MEQPMENVSTNDTAKRTSEGPNIIGNAEEGPRPSGINFKPFMHHEENKRPAANEKLSLDQFARKVSNKNNLLYTLSVKGKTAHFPLIFFRLQARSTSRSGATAPWSSSVPCSTAASATSRTKSSARSKSRATSSSPTLKSWTTVQRSQP